MNRLNSTQLVDAVGLIESKKYDEAIALLEEFLRDNHSSIEGWYNLGIAYALAEEYDAAVKSYDEALAIDNGIFEVWFNKATVLYEMADFKGAKQCYEEALELRPNDAEAWNNLGNVHSRLGEGREAIDAYTRAVLLDAGYAEAFYNKANAHFIEEEYERAVAYADLALELNPELSTKITPWIQIARSKLEAKRKHEERLRKRRQEDGQRTS
ncbi:MAG: tetratricopeptide repeat protein [Candidatus Thorarchaeota archaeon]|nr:tetratricopeptide repeat protein [Candidatus Thorarchaeota archaeon]